MLFFFGSCFLLFALFIVFQLFRKLTGGVAEEKPLSNNNSSPQTKYDVFVSFSGKNIRRGFLSHLIDSFERKKINAFVDDRLEKGEEIWPSLVEAIEGSLVSVVIFSPDYSSSRWCLAELVTILECKEKYGRRVIPVFYRVEPMNVRHQLGSYENAFAKHSSRHKTEVVDNWRHALKKAADLAGIVSSQFGKDAELVTEIVNFVLEKLPKIPVNSKKLVGIDKKISAIVSWIREEPKDTHLIGIWGMGGVGKTTLAEEVFNKLQSEDQYDGCCFLANEREESDKRGIISLKQQIFSKLLGNDVKIYTENSLPEDVVRRIGFMKVIIVLDDVNDLSHLEKLLGALDRFGLGSKIIVTTRDEQVLKGNNVHKTYHLTELNSKEALDLFTLNVFNQNDHEYNELSEKVVKYAHGIPLVVKVLAGLLRGKNKEEWESMLHKLKRLPPTEVFQVLKLSYDGLDRKEKHIFLDLACFFLRIHTMVNVSDLKSLLKDDESDDSVAFMLVRLKDKALITISKDDIVSMHHSLQEMAWEIVRQESPEDLGSRSRLWDPDDIYKALKKDKVNEVIRSLQINLTTIKGQKLMPHIFAKMSRLKFLEISGEDKDDCYDKIILAAEWFQFLANELRFLSWDHYPLKSLPENFSAEELVILKMEHSFVEKLWDGVKDLVNLKEVDLSYSDIKELPDLSKATNLEKLVLEACSKLISVHPSIFSLRKLEKLDLFYCKSVTILTSKSHLCSLSYLNLTSCFKLTEFSLISENMKELRLSSTKVKTLPSSFGHQSKLELLDLNRNRKLETIIELPPFIKVVDVTGCTSLKSLPELPLSLQTLNVHGCLSLESLPVLPLSLKVLDISLCESLEALPDLPLSLETLDATSCTSLRSVLFPSTFKENRKRVLFGNCLNLDEDSLVTIGLNAQISVMNSANRYLSASNHDHVQNYSDSDRNHRSYEAALYVYPGDSVPKWLEYKTREDEDYVIIDLSSAPPSPFQAFIFCFVIGHYNPGGFIFSVQVKITVSDCEGEGEGTEDNISVLMDCYITGDLKGSDSFDHVCVMCDQRCCDFLNSKAKHQTRLKIHVTILQARGILEEFPNPVSLEMSPRNLRGFGVSPIATSTYNSLIRQMEMCDSNSMHHFS